MSSKSHKDFIKPTAEALGHSEILTEDIVEFFYNRLQKMIGSMEHQQIEVISLGTFKVRPSKLDELIESKVRHLDKLEIPRTMTQMDIKRNVEVELEKARNLKDLMDKEQKRKEEFYKNKYGEQSDQNMEEQGEDS